MNRILIVDDREENIYLLHEQLQDQGYEVVSAVNGADALDKARQDPPDLIITDIQMPVMDGFALCREWKKDGLLKPIPFVFYTGTYTGERDREFAISLGAERFIVKTQEQDALMAIIRETIRKAGSPPAARATPAAGIPARLPVEAPGEETVYLKHYNEALIRKLESKMEQLKRSNRELEQDIAARKRAEDNLKASEVRYRRLFESAKDGILILNAATGEIEDVNPFLADLLGFTHDELLHKKLWEIGPFKDCCASKTAFAELQSREYIRYEDLPLETRDGRQIAVEFVRNVYVADSTKVIQCNIRDITARKRMEKEKESLQSQFLHAQKMEAVGTLAGGVAHDFNNLLTAISGYTDLAMVKTDESDPRYTYLNRVSNAVKSASGVIRQLLLFSRKQPVEEHVPFNLNETIENVLKMIGRIIGENVVIETDFEKELYTIKGDEGNIEQVLMNLSVNARDAMADGGKIFLKTENVTLDEKHCAKFSKARSGSFVCLSIKDTGAGMDKETLQRIFEPFFTTKEVGKGTGLGLSVVHGIVEQHKGWIDVFSKPGKGTTFKIYFQAAFVNIERKSEGTVSPAALKGNGQRILIVEDQEEVRDLAVQILRENGYSVFYASSAKEAKAAFGREQGKFDMVFSDVVLPDGNGVRLVDELLKRGTFAVLFTSGYTDEKAGADMIKLKNHRFLHKPYTVMGLLLAVNEVLR
ncbi:MAG: response regulator [Chitinispirillaceae bacterium]|nr:response regulator [Chitinispirillaceae bacterium]